MQLEVTLLTPARARYLAQLIPDNEDRWMSWSSRACHMLGAAGVWWIASLGRGPRVDSIGSRPLPWNLSGHLPAAALP